jgi:hypothetical protein
MRPHELEALRRLFFFTPPEAAALVGGVSEQAWRRWEAGTRAIPRDVAQRMEDLAALRRAAIEDAAAKIADAPPDAVIKLICYQSVKDWRRDPIFWHVHQSACAEILASYPSRVQLVIFDRAAYSAWRGRREDSELLRTQWMMEN